MVFFVFFFSEAEIPLNLIFSLPGPILTPLFLIRPQVGPQIAKRKSHFVCFLITKSEG